MDYSKKAHFPISVDSVIFGYTKGELKIALIKRKKPPFVSMWAIPGGFIEGDETVEETALRELTEETGISDIMKFMKKPYMPCAGPSKPARSLLSCCLNCLH